jgi:hypothetical protein
MPGEAFLGQESDETESSPPLAKDGALAADDSTLQSVRDDTPWRAAEHEALFRLFENVKTTPEDRLRASSLGFVGYLALFKQPEAYRGKLVGVRGTARLAYYMQAPANQSGIPGYYVFWLRPEGGPNSPLVVFALELPGGFPPIRNAGEDGATTPLAEDLEFTAYFFKRWAYRAQDGIRTAPLLLARQPRWLAASPVQPPPTSSVSVILVVVGAAGVSMALAVAAYLSTRTRRRRDRWHGESGDRLEIVSTPMTESRPDDALESSGPWVTDSRNGREP